MKTTIKIAVFLILIIHSGLGLKGQNTLKTEVAGTNGLQGDIYFSLYDRESAWMYTDSAYRKVILPVETDPQVITLENIPKGDYAIAVFLDVNRNAEMDQTDFRIPKEPFGFSNNPKGLRGPASFKQSLFHFNGQDTVRIEMVNNIFTPNKEKDEKQK